MIKLSLDKVIYTLLCLYVVLVPFELILEVLLGVKTIFKPYRIVSLLLIGLFALKQLVSSSITLSLDRRTDFFLYFVLFYGLLISFYNMIVAEFSSGKFYNEIFQTGLYLSVFIIIKNTVLSQWQLRRLVNFLLLGISLNALYVFYNYYLLGHLGRQSGFFDNPNYLSLSVTYAMVVLLAYLQEVNWRQKAALLFLLLMLLSVFLIAGSRMGLAVLVLVLVILFLYQNLQIKALLSGVAIVLALFVFSTENRFNNSDRSKSVLASRLKNRDLAEEPRFPIWRGIIRASEKTYFLGLGLGQFEARFPEFYQGENNRVISEVLNYGYFLSPHSDYMAVLITYGIIGLICFLIFYYLSFLRLYRSLLVSRNSATTSLLLIQLLGLVAITLFGIGSENFVSGLYWIILALSTKSLSNRSEQPQLDQSLN